MRRELLRRSKLVGQGHTKRVYVLSSVTATGDRSALEEKSWLVAKLLDTRSTSNHTNADVGLSEMAHEADIEALLVQRGAKFVPSSDLAPFVELRANETARSFWLCDTDVLPPILFSEFLPLTINLLRGDVLTLLVKRSSCALWLVLIEFARLLVAMERADALLCDWHRHQFRLAFPSLAIKIVDFDAVFDVRDAPLHAGSACNATRRSAAACSVDRCFRHAQRHVGDAIGELDCLPRLNLCRGFGTAANTYGFASMVADPLLNATRTRFPTVAMANVWELRVFITAMKHRRPDRRPTPTEIERKLLELSGNVSARQCLRSIMEPSELERRAAAAVQTLDPMPWAGEYRVAS